MRISFSPSTWMKRLSVVSKCCDDDVPPEENHMPMCAISDATSSHVKMLDKFISLSSGVPGPP
jgi:hypothetical protein